MDKDLEKKHLKYISDDILGIRRQKKGTGFIYLDQNGVVIRNANTLEWINSLAIPPAWTDIWINPFVSGHLQATGIDSKGRKQYIYHPAWVEICQENKFKHIPIFYKSLPKIRGKVRYHLSLEKLVKERVLATVVWLLEHTFIRVGNTEYAKENSSYGLTTLRDKHLTTQGKAIIFQFKGKSGVKHTVKVLHPSIVKTIKKCVELPGYELFKFVDEGEVQVVDSGDVNAYLKDATGEDITAKDFRTWGGSVICAQTLFEIGDFQGEELGKKNVVGAVKKVARDLRNTPSVCRNYYIHPVVIDAYQKHQLVPHFAKFKSKKIKLNDVSIDEYALNQLIINY